MNHVTLPAEQYSEIVLSNNELPADIAAYRVKLTETRAAVVQFGRNMDGILFGIGADGVVSLIPVVGDAFCGLMTFSLMGKAKQVHMSLGERLVILGLGTLDTAIGLMPGIGDVADALFRSHAWSANRIIAHIDQQLAQIEALSHLPATGPEMDQLRDALFRGGKTQQEVWVRTGLIAAACVGLLGYCSYQSSQETLRREAEAKLRHERVVACEARGGWFCSLK